MLWMGGLNCLVLPSELGEAKMSHPLIDEIKAILMTYKNIESDIPIGHRYWALKQRAYGVFDKVVAKVEEPKIEEVKQPEIEIPETVIDLDFLDK